MERKKTLEESILKMDILMWKVIKLLIKRKKLVLDQFGLTCSQFDILSAINYFTTIKTEIIQVDLSEKTAIDPMTTSTILRNLEKKELITRYRNTENTRTVIVHLTDKGLCELEKAYLQIRLSNMEIYKNVDIDQLTSQLQRLLEKLNN